MPVTVLSRDGHYRQRFAAGRSPLALPDKQQVAVKRNILTSTFIPHPLLSQQAFSRFVQDYLMFGNAYLENERTGWAVFFRWSHYWRNIPAAGSTSTLTGLCNTA